MKKLLIISMFVLLPSFSFAATDTEIRSSLLQTLLTQFVSQVNALDTMRTEISLSSNPSQFSMLTAVLSAQLQYTTQSVAALLNPATVSVPVPSVPSVNFGSASASSEPAPVGKAAITVDVQNPSQKFPYYVFVVSVLNDEGKTIQQAPIHMSAPDSQVDRAANQDDGNTNGLPRFTYTSHFVYGEQEPLTPGIQVVTFTSGNLSKSITINVQ